MKARHHRLRLALPALSLAFAACSEPTPVAENPIQAHSKAWSDPAAADWHGTRVEREGTGTCTACHGSDLRGDLVVPGCYDCHDGPGGHPATWRDPPAPFHGMAVEAAGPSGCTSCHGSTYQGGWSGVSCYDCHAGGPSGHPDGWMNPDAHTFHGRTVALQGDNDCRRCQGNDLMGGTSGVACGDCHF